MHRIEWIVLVFLGAAVAAPAAGAGDYTGRGFSADMLFAQNGETPEPMGSIYMSRKTMRYESGRSITLIDLASRKFVTLMQDQKIYMEMPSSQRMAPKYEENPCADYESRTKIGSETVNGRATTKWRCTGQKPPRGVEPSDATLWYDGKLMFWMRSARDTGDVTELHNVAVGKQPDSLFKISEGYQQFNMGSAQQLQQDIVQRQDAYMNQMRQEQEAQRQHERKLQQRETMNNMLELLLENQNE